MWLLGVKVACYKGCFPNTNQIRCLSVDQICYFNSDVRCYVEIERLHTLQAPIRYQSLLHLRLRLPAGQGQQQALALGASIYNIQATYHGTV